MAALHLRGHQSRLPADDAPPDHFQAVTDRYPVPFGDPERAERDRYVVAGIRAHDEVHAGSAAGLRDAVDTGHVTRDALECPRVVRWDRPRLHGDQDPARDEQPPSGRHVDLDALPKPSPVLTAAKKRGAP